MRGWQCDRCGQVVFLDSSQCLRCGAFLGFRPSTLRVEALTGDETICATAATSGCTWIVEDAPGAGAPAQAPPPGVGGNGASGGATVDDTTAGAAVATAGGGVGGAVGDVMCVACRQVTLVPPLHDPETARRYRLAADDHRHLVVQLLELGLPVDAVELRLPSGSYDGSVTIGHADGVVTLDVDEADDAQREAARHSLGERYRTVLGHLRHEYGHALFDHVVGPDGIDRVRATFGDEREDYRAALDQHYAQGPPTGWERTHVSAYATMHPSEDWAETFAHVLHVTDVLATTESFGLRLDPGGIAASSVPVRTGGRTATSPMREGLERFVPLALALNAVTRAMGEGALYPFVLTEQVTAKLELVAELIGLDRVP